MKLSISERDKTLLCVVACLIVVFLSWFYGFKGFNEKKDALDKEIATLQVKYKDLQEKQENKDKYEEEAVVYEAYFEAMLERYATGTSQKDTIIFASELEVNTGVWAKSVTLNEADTIHTFGQISSSNPDKSGSVYSTDLKGLKKTTTYIYECTYDELKVLLEYFENYETKYTIDSISMSYSAEEELVSGSLTVSQYVITGKDREFEEIMIENVQTGTDNLFNSSTFVVAKGEENKGNTMLTDYDVAITLNSEAADMDSVVIGRKGMATSQITANYNGVVNATIIIEGENGAYTMSYSVGENKYPLENYEKGKSFNPGDSLDLIVYSSERENARDEAGVKLKVENNSDLTLNIKVINEDTAKPRFELGSTKGSVNVYQ